VTVLQPSREVPANVLAITGGTGSYKGAKGTLTLQDVTSKITAERFAFR
jgi:hypothetical protein